MKHSIVVFITTLVVVSCSVTHNKVKTIDSDIENTTSKESPDWWYQQGALTVEKLAEPQSFPRKAKNVILFIGDGMNITTITAARILQGQNNGQYGEENQLSFEKFPQTALSKTYNTNLQTPDSAGTMSAMMTGVKTKGGVIAVDGTVNKGECQSGINHQRITLLQKAEQRGMSTAVISTARLTHATPAATYAHSVSRYWEADSDIPIEQRQKGCKDIASQLIDFSYGNGLEVAMGGGRKNFLPVTIKDPEYKNKTGVRTDKRDLTQEWLNKFTDAQVVWNQQQFDQIDPNKTRHLLGLFESSHMQYEQDRQHDKAGEPSLAEMTEKGLQILNNIDKPYFMMVEAGRIDHGHHDGIAHKALTDTIALSDAVNTALNSVDLNETLIIVTADHSHTFNMAGYPQRGNPILGLAKGTDEAGHLVGKLLKDADGRPFTTLGYANGPGYVNAGERPDLTYVDVEAPDYKQAATYPMESETHSGEDVAVYATGAGSYTVHGTIEQNVIYHIMKHALDLN